MVAAGLTLQQTEANGLWSNQCAVMCTEPD